MVQNHAPNVLTRIQDKSLGVIPVGTGNVAFTTGATWGPGNEILTITDDLFDKLGKPVIGVNQTSLLSIDQHLLYSGAAKVVRAIADDVTSVNSMLIVNSDAGALLAWDDATFGVDLNGANQTNKINEDDSDPAVDFMDLEKLIVSSASGDFQVGETVTGGTSLATGVIVYVNSDNTVIYIKDHTPGGGTDPFEAVEVITGSISTETATVTSLTQNTDQIIDIYAKYAGATGNDIKVAICDPVQFDAGDTYDGTNTFAQVVADKTQETYLNTKLVLSNVSTAFELNEVVTDGSGGSGTVDRISNNNVYIKTITTDFTLSDILTGATSGCTATIDGIYPDLAVVVIFENNVEEAHVVSTHVDEITLQGNKPKFIDYYLELESDFIESVSQVSGTTNVYNFDGSFLATSLSGGASAQPGLTELYSAYDKIFGDRKNEIYLVTDNHDFASYSESNYNTLAAYMCAKADNSRRHFVITTLPTAAIDANNFNVTDVDTSITGLNSKYCAIYTEWKQIYDRYNRRKVYIPLSGDIAGIHILSMENYGEWEAPFGNIKGLLRNCTKLYHNLEQGGGSPVSELARVGLNNVIYKDGIGHVVWGNRTRYNATSDLSAINAVHTLTKDLITLERLLDNFISFNINEGTFGLVRNTADRGYLEKRSNRGAYNTIDGDGGYLFICDSSNNNAATVKAKKLIVHFYVKPAKAVEFVELTAIITPAGVEFSEIISN
jgi:hypothetical protein